MTSQDIKNKILSYEMEEEELFNYLDDNFKSTIIGVINAIYELLINYDKNIDLINYYLSILELITKQVSDINNIKVFHIEIKKLIGSIHKYLKPLDNDYLKLVIKRLQIMGRYLKELMIYDDAKKKLEVMELIISNNRNLKVIASLIRDNKNILKIKDDKNENILYKLLKKYAYLDDEEEINFLYQVISLFINSEDLNIEIIKNIDYYLLALNNKNKKHINDIKRQLEIKKGPILLSDLENRYKIYTTYSKVIESELNSFNMMHNGAVDLRNQECYTIDGEGTECLDDCLYFEKNKDGSYTLYVHITYLPSIVPYMSKMNRESIRRVETYYLLDGAYTLYPSYVSNYLASLLPNNVRYTETGIWLVEPDMTIVEDSFKLVKSVIKSYHRLTYDGADEIIGSKSSDLLCSSLTDLGIFALRQRERNKTKEVYRRLENSNNPIHESRLVNELVSANIVQECALLFGKSKAEYYSKRGLPYIYRACGIGQKLDLDSNLLRNLSLDNQSDISRMIAYYTSTPEAHNGLGYDVYCHGGSPARRSPDGQNQYIDEDLIFNPKLNDKMVYIWEERTKNLASYYNETTQRIDAFSSQYNYLMSKKLIKKP